MSLVAAPAPNAASPSTTLRHSAGPVLLSGITWQTYEALLADIANRPIRLTYDRGSLEIMAPAFRHELTSKWIGQLVEVIAEEANMPYINGGSTTFRREDLERGLEPDECFYFVNEARVRGREEIDLSRDPPPDLAIEVDVTSSSISRMSIYAALGVSEVWRWRDDTFAVHRLQGDMTYAAVHASPTFPCIPLAELAKFIEQAYSVDHLTLKRAFRTWVREIKS